MAQSKMVRISLKMHARLVRLQQALEDQQGRFVPLGVVAEKAIASLEKELGENHG